MIIGTYCHIEPEHHTLIISLKLLTPKLHPQVGIKGMSTSKISWIWSIKSKLLSPDSRDSTYAYYAKILHAKRVYPWLLISL